LSTSIPSTFSGSKKEAWDIEYHNHNFYELIIIENGKGFPPPERYYIPI
jgi:hypothetical protein